jgi:1,2-diacylglycerol 3-alpha-glucosyltransferase
VRIGFFTDTYLPVANGICYVIDILRDDLEKAGHEVWVFAPRDLRWHLPKEDRVIRYNAVGGLFYEDQFNSFFWPPKQFKKVKQLNLDMIVAFTPTFIGAFGSYCAQRLNIPYVIQYGTDLEAYSQLYKPATFAGILAAPFLAPYLLRLNAGQTLGYWRGFFKWPRHEPYLTYITRHMLTALHAKADLVVATSDKIAEKLRRWPVKQTICTVPTGVDSLPPKPTFKKHFMEKYGLKRGDEIILYAGRMSAEKNLEMLIDAFVYQAASRPNSKLLLAGDFQHRWKLEEKAAKTAYASQIIFTGRLERSELGAVYSLADVFAFPSMSDCQALVINEAAHAGAALVWCDRPSLNPILIDTVTGLQAYNDKVDFGSKMALILENGKLRQKLSKGARREAAKYTEQIQTSKLLSELAKLTKAN